MGCADTEARAFRQLFDGGECFGSIHHHFVYLHGVVTVLSWAYLVAWGALRASSEQLQMLIEDNLSRIVEDKVKMEAPRFGNWNKFIPDMSNEAEVKLRQLRDKKNIREMRRKTRKNLGSMQEIVGGDPAPGPATAVKRQEPDLAAVLAVAPVTPPRVHKDCP